MFMLVEDKQVEMLHKLPSSCRLGWSQSSPVPQAPKPETETGPQSLPTSKPSVLFSPQSLTVPRVIHISFEATSGERMKDAIYTELYTI